MLRRTLRLLGSTIRYRDLAVSIYIAASTNDHCHWPGSNGQQKQPRRPTNTLANLQRGAVVVKRCVNFGRLEILISAAIRLFTEGAFEAVSELGAIMEELNGRWPSSFGLFQPWRLWVFPSHHLVRGSSRGHDSIISELIVWLD